MSDKFNNIEKKLREKITSSPITPPKELWDGILLKSTAQQTNKNSIFFLKLKKRIALILVLLSLSVGINIYLLLNNNNRAKHNATASKINNPEIQKTPNTEDKPEAPLNKNQSQANLQTSDTNTHNNKKNYHLSEQVITNNKHTDSSKNQNSTSSTNSDINKKIALNNNQPANVKHSTPSNSAPLPLSKKLNKEQKSPYKTKNFIAGINSASVFLPYKFIIKVPTTRQNKNTSITKRYIAFHSDINRIYIEEEDESNYNNGHFEESFGWGGSFLIAQNIFNSPHFIYSGIGLQKILLIEEINEQDIDPNTKEFESVFGLFDLIEEEEDENELLIKHSGLYLEIPIGINYKLFNYKSLSLILDANFSLYSTLRSKNKFNTSILREHSTNILKNRAYVYKIGVTLERPVKQYKIYIEPFYKAYISSITNSKTMVVKPQMTGINIGIKSFF